MEDQARFLSEIYGQAKRLGYKVTHVRAVERKNHKGPYTFVEVHYLIPGTDAEQEVADRNSELTKQIIELEQNYQPKYETRSKE